MKLPTLRHAPRPFPRYPRPSLATAIVCVILLLAAGCNRQGRTGVTTPTPTPTPMPTPTPEASVTERKITINGLDSVAIAYTVNIGPTPDPNALVPDPNDDDKDIHPTARIDKVEVFDNTGTLKQMIPCKPRLCSVDIEVNGAGDIEVDGRGAGMHVKFNRNKYRPRVVQGKIEHYKKTAVFNPRKLKVEYGDGSEENISCPDFVGGAKCRIVIHY